MIVRFCQARFSMSPESADEAAQVVLVKLLQNMSKFEYDSRQSFRAWLTRVTRNSVIDSMRQLRIDRGVGGSDVIDRLSRLSADESDEAFSDQLSLELRQSLFGECEKLVQQRVSEQTWAAFTMLRGGQKAADVGQQLGMTVAAVYRAKTRVLKFFREEVALKLKARN